MGNTVTCSICLYDYTPDNINIYIKSVKICDDCKRKSTKEKITIQRNALKNDQNIIRQINNTYSHRCYFYFI